MSLHDKSLVELKEIAEGLRQTIKRTPKHSDMEQVELQAVEQLIREAKAKAQAEPDDIVF